MGLALSSGYLLILVTVVKLILALTAGETVLPCLTQNPRTQSVANQHLGAQLGSLLNFQLILGIAACASLLLQD